MKKIDILLFLGRGDSGVIKLQKEVFSLNELIKEVIKETELLCQDRILNYNIQEQINIFADRKLIKQMLRAIVDNSIKFTQQMGIIKISATKIFDKVKIVIEDNGIGIPRRKYKKYLTDFIELTKFEAELQVAVAWGCQL